MRGWSTDTQSKPAEIRWQRYKDSKKRYEIASQSAHLAKEKKKHIQTGDLEKAHFCHLQSLNSEELRAAFGGCHNPTPNAHEDIPIGFIVSEKKLSKSKPICCMVGAKDHKWTNVYEKDLIRKKIEIVEHRYDNDLDDEVIVAHPNDYAEHRGITEVHGASGGEPPYIPPPELEAMVPKSARVVSDACGKQKKKEVDKPMRSKQAPQSIRLYPYKRDNINKKIYSRGDRMVKALAMMSLNQSRANLLNE